jgi:methionyl-tRNA formyltransferase
MQRVVVFTDWIAGVPAILLRATLEALVCRDDMRLSAVCLPGPQPYARTLCHHFLYRALLAFESLVDPQVQRLKPPDRPPFLHRLAHRHRFRILVPEQGDINHTAFLARLRNEIKPTAALSFYCLQKFSSHLLSVFNHTVNYHNGLLPKYRGLNATSWSVYRGERWTGFTFHRMDEAFDEGPILLQSAVPVDSRQRACDLDLLKAAKAATFIPRLLAMIAEEDPGVPQRGAGSYFSNEDRLSVTRIADPSRLALRELQQRLQAFDSLELNIAGNWLDITRIRKLPDHARKRGRLCFRTADGILVAPTRFRHHAYGVYSVIEGVRKIVPF